MKKKLLIILASIFFITVSHSYINTIEADTINYLCFTAQEDESSVKLDKNGSPTIVNLEIKKNSGSWETYNIGDTINLNYGDKVYIRNTSTTTTEFNGGTNNYEFVMTGKLAASGDITTLINKNGTKNLNGFSYVFSNLFSDCTSLTSAPELPATTLSEYCYYSMFNNCTNLTSTPSLPATTLSYGCYMDMFTNCQSLFTIPEISASTLAGDCFRNMFSGCTGIRTSSSSGDNYTQIRIPSNGSMSMSGIDVSAFSGMLNCGGESIPHPEDLYNGGAIIVYVAIPFFVTYDGNGNTDGYVHIDTKPYYSDDLVTVLGEDKISRVGYTFKEWNTKADGSGSSYQKDNTFNITKNITLYATWVPINYSVTYNSNGATSGTVPTDSNTYHYNNKATVLGNIGSLAKTNQAFKGWNTQSDGSGTTYMPSSEIKITDNITLHAIWGDYSFIDDSGIGSVSGNKKYVKKSLKDLLFTCDGPKDECQKVYVDGIELTENVEYTIESGSTKVTLKGTYLETLDLGDHTLKLAYNNGQEPTTSFKVVNPSSPDSSKNKNKYIAPNTGVN